MRAVVDIGTNTSRMLIGEVKEGKIKVHSQFLAEPRLGAGITKGILTEEAIERTIKALNGFKTIIQKHAINDVIVMATSAARDAVNKNEFINEVYQKTGWQVQVISGEKEAELSYRGAVASVSMTQALSVVIDIGGGSTEAIFTWENKVQATSVNVGAVRYLETNWTEEELKKHLSPLIRDLARINEKKSLVAVGGTATTAAAIHYKIKEYSREEVQGKILTLDNIKALKEVLWGMDPQDRKNVIGLTPKRADIIIPGLKILISIMELINENSIIVSDAGILDGMLICY